MFQKRIQVIGIVCGLVMIAFGCESVTTSDFEKNADLQVEQLSTEGNHHIAFPSTNELNKNKEVPGREGQIAPYVDQLSVGIGEVELEFVNEAPGLAVFEYRLDGEVLTSGTPHPLNDYPEYPYIHDDFLYSYVSVSSGDTETMLFEAQEKVEVRLALGGERDWDFDWVTFEVLPDAQTKNDCKKGGWEEYGFKNQGQCIRFVNTGKDSR